jgi:excisionase family DNA binding protein
MKVKLRNNANSSRTGVNRSSKYIVVYHKKGETLGMNKIFNPIMKDNSIVKAFLDFIARNRKANLATADQVTTQEAAKILNVSRPYVIQLLDSDEIPCHKVENRRRIFYQDLIEYKNIIDAKRRETLAELANQAQELNMGY